MRGVGLLVGTGILAFFAFAMAVASEKIKLGQAAAGAIVVYAAVGARTMALLNARVPIISCFPDMPLFTQEGSNLGARVLSIILAESLTHPEGMGQHLDQKAFKRSRGFVLKFNHDGAARLYDPTTPWHFLLPFFERVRDPEATAFVLNVLVVSPTPSNSTDAAVALHIDNTVAISSDHEFIAHTVSVLYLAVPDLFSGGTLELFAPQPSTLSIGEMARAVRDQRPEALITPSTVDDTDLVTFRGDAYHRVSAMRVVDDTHVDEQLLRVSLVLEQYRITAEHYPRTAVFTVNSEKAHYGAKHMAVAAAALVRSMTASLALVGTLAGVLGALAYLSWTRSVGLLATLAALASMLAALV